MKNVIKCAKLFKVAGAVETAFFDPPRKAKNSVTYFGKFSICLEIQGL